MALQIRLGDADRERLGCPEWVEYDFGSLTLTEAEILDDHGVTWDGELRYGTPVLDADGKAVLNADGRPMRTFKPRATRVWVWSALRRAGVDVPFAELDFDTDAMSFKATGEADSGKEPGSDSDAPSTPSPSETNGGTTPRSSPASGPGRRKSPVG